VVRSEFVSRQATPKLSNGGSRLAPTDKDRAEAYLRAWRRLMELLRSNRHGVDPLGAAWFVAAARQEVERLDGMLDELIAKPGTAVARVWHELGEAPGVLLSGARGYLENEAVFVALHSGEEANA
jgi:hypothetical protein